MADPISLKEAINGQNFITALEGKKMHFNKKGKAMVYTNLFISEGVVYASSIREDNAKIIGTVIVTNFKTLGRKDVLPSDKIKIIQILPTADVIGEIMA